MAEQMKLDIDLPRARSGRAELMDHRKREARRGKGNGYSEWPKLGTVVEVILADPTELGEGCRGLGSVAAELMGVEIRDGHRQGRFRVRTDLMPDLSDSMRAWLPETITGVKLTALRRRKEGA